MALSTPIRVLSIEDHPVVREDWSTIIGSQPDMALGSQTADVVQAIAECRRHRPDGTAMDLRLPGTNGIHARLAADSHYQRAGKHAGS